jgi:4-carboxymuconolactone decarboxylase
VSYLPDIAEDISPELAETIHAVVETNGFMPNLFRALAHAPIGVRHLAALDAYCQHESDLTARQRLLAILIGMRDVHYGRPRFVPQALEAGLTAAQLELIRVGRAPRDLPADEYALCEFSFEVTATRGIPPRVVAAVKEHFTPRQITDIALLTAQCMAASALAIGLDVPPDSEPVLRQEREWRKKGGTDGS